MICLKQSKSFTGVFCDDTLLAKEIKQQSDATELQKDLDNVLEWTKLWGMQFNTVKCVFITITNNRNPILTQYQVEKVNLEKKEMVKYLGVTIDKKINFEHHIKEKCKSATIILNMLRRNLYFAPKSVKCKAYMACVLPILEYASTCWSPTSAKMNNSLEMMPYNEERFITNTYIRNGKFMK